MSQENKKVTKILLKNKVFKIVTCWHCNKKVNYYDAEEAKIKDAAGLIDIYLCSACIENNYDQDNGSDDEEIKEKITKRKWCIHCSKYDCNVWHMSTR